MLTVIHGLRQNLAIILLILVFVGIYSWGIGYFSPSSIFQHDEYMVLISPIQMYARGDWIAHQTSSPPPAGRHDYFQTMLGPPHTFHYILIASVHTVYRIGKVFGFYKNPFDLVADNGNLVKVIGRTLIIFCSAGALWMTYRIGRLVFQSERVALMAVPFMGLSWYYFYNSKIAKVDVPMIFFVTVSMYFLLRASEEGKARQYFWSGLFCGLSAGIKLPGTFMVLPIIFVYVTNAIRGRESYVPIKLMVAGVAAFIGVFGTNPNLLIYFSDLLWAIKEFDADLKAQGGITHPWYHYYATLDSPKFLLTTTFPGMFSGQIPTYLAIAGFFIVLYRRRLKEYALIAFPVFYLLLKLPSLVSQIYREYHVCIFVMALLAAYALHHIYQNTVERWVKNRLFHVACLSVVLLVVLKGQMAYANRFNYYATEDSNKQIAVDWVDRHLPPDARFVVSDLVSVNRPSQDFSHVASYPDWPTRVVQEFDYAMIVPFKAAILFSYCEQNAKLIKKFSALSTGYADIHLYRLAKSKEKTPPVANSRNNRGNSQKLRLKGDHPLLQVYLQKGCQAHLSHTAWLQLEASMIPVALPAHADAVYVRLPGQYAGQELTCNYAILPLDLPPREQVAGIEDLKFDGRQTAVEYTFTDNTRQILLTRDPEELLRDFKNTSPERQPVLNLPRYLAGLLQDGTPDSLRLEVMPVDEEIGSFKEIIVERRNDLSALQFIQADDHPTPIRLNVIQKNDSEVRVPPPLFVRMEIQRVDATRSVLLFQNQPASGDTLRLPPVSLRSGDHIRLKFTSRRNDL